MKKPTAIVASVVLALTVFSGPVEAATKRCSMNYATSGFTETFKLVKNFATPRGTLYDFVVTRDNGRIREVEDYITTQESLTIGKKRGAVVSVEGSVNWRQSGEWQEVACSPYER